MSANTWSGSITVRAKHCNQYSTYLSKINLIFPSVLKGKKHETQKRTKKNKKNKESIQVVDSCTKDCCFMAVRWRHIWRSSKILGNKYIKWGLPEIRSFHRVWKAKRKKCVVPSGWERKRRPCKFIGEILCSYRRYRVIQGEEILDANLN